MASISYSSNSSGRVNRAGASKKSSAPDDDDDEEEDFLRPDDELDAVRECSILSRNALNDALTSSGAPG